MLKKNVLITGGTSGLGKELAVLFLKNEFTVVATGRQLLALPGYDDDFRLFRVDFSDLKQTSETIKLICGSYKFDIVINNAGILSPPDLTLTNDGNEYTFQVNYLAHLLINETIIMNQADQRPLTICTITSPVYRMGNAGSAWTDNRAKYRPIKAYSYSKLLLALMCRDLPAKYPGRNMICFSFDPGIFSSGIYRMQSPFFGFLYRIAAPFMRSPARVADVLFNILTGNELKNGVIYNIRKKIRNLPDVSDTKSEALRKGCYNKINAYLE